MGQYTNEQKSKCAAREAAMRKNVYRKFVAAGTMKQEQADYEVAVMSEIAADYARVSDTGSFEGLQRAVMSLSPTEQAALLPKLLRLAADIIPTSEVGIVKAGFDAALVAP
jgi:hypothetical protein